jgi:short-subunit dehydrogenase
MALFCVLYSIGLLCLLRTVFIFWQWLQSYVSPIVDVKKRFQTEWAVVLGASAGLGKNIALLLAEQGVNVIGTGRDQRALEEVQRLCEQKAVQFEPVFLDLFDRDASDKLMNACGDRDIGVCVITAGFGVMGAMSRQRDTQGPWSTTEFLYLMGTAYVVVMRDWIVRLRKRKAESAIGVTASVASHIVMPTFALYYSVKAYVSRMVKYMMIENEGTGVTVTALHPGHFFGDSKLFRHLGPEFQKATDNLGNLLPRADGVARCFMSVIGRTDGADATYDSLIFRTAEWILGEWLQYKVGRRLFLSLTKLFGAFK